MRSGHSCRAPKRRRLDDDLSTQAPSDYPSQTGSTYQSFTSEVYTEEYSAIHVPGASINRPYTYDEGWDEHIGHEATMEDVEDVSVECCYGMVRGTPIHPMRLSVDD
jgi:hypothetical protein